MSRRRNNPASGVVLCFSVSHCCLWSLFMSGSWIWAHGGGRDRNFSLPESSMAPWESRAEDPDCNKAFFCLTLFWEETLSIYNVSGTTVSVFLYLKEFNPSNSSFGVLTNYHNHFHPTVEEIETQSFLCRWALQSEWVWILALPGPSCLSLGNTQCAGALVERAELEEMVPVLRTSRARVGPSQVSPPSPLVATGWHL